MAAPSVTEFYVLQALGNYLSFLLPDIEIVRGQDNRVSEPNSPDFAVMTPVHRGRLATTEDIPADCSFIGNIVGYLLTITEPLIGTPQLQSAVFGVGVEPNTIIVSNGLTENTFVVSPEQNVSSSKLACGQMLLLQSTELVIQVDVHGPNSGDNVQVLEAALRDDYACEWFEANFPNVVPLWADEARQAPFQNAEQQIEFRWVLEVHLEIDPTIPLPQQFADQVQITITPPVDLLP
jgi:hypothetical protein